jgi:RNA polymerase sigma-70 factor (ECF subfamily)
LRPSSQAEIDAGAGKVRQIDHRGEGASGCAASMLRVAGLGSVTPGSTRSYVEDVERIAVAQSQRHDMWQLEPAVASAPAVRRSRGFPSQARLLYGNLVTVAGKPESALDQEFVRMRATLARYLRSRGAADQTEDFVQELWLKIAALPSDIEIAEPSSYLYRMAHNLMLDKRRAEARRGARERLYVQVADGGDDGVDPAPTPERVLEARRSLDAIQRVLAGLGERTDYIFRRHRVDGIGQREIAAELGITLSAVEKHLQKAYKAVHGAQVRGGEHGLA